MFTHNNAHRRWGGSSSSRVNTASPFNRWTITSTKLPAWPDTPDYTSGMSDHAATFVGNVIDPFQGVAMRQYWPSVFGVLILLGVAWVVSIWCRRPSTGLVSQRISRISAVTVVVGFTLPMLVPTGPQWFFLTAGVLLLTGTVGLVYGQIHRKVEEHRGRRLRAQMGLSARRRRLPAWLVGGAGWVVTVFVVIILAARLPVEAAHRYPSVVWLLIVPLLVGLAAAWAQDMRREQRDRQIAAEDRAAAGGLELLHAQSPLWVPGFARKGWVDWQERLDAPVAEGREWAAIRSGLLLMAMTAAGLIVFWWSTLTTVDSSLRESTATNADLTDTSGLFTAMVALACLVIGAGAVAFFSEGWRTAIRQLRARRTLKTSS